jgi:hypothetical protein
VLNNQKRNTIRSLAVLAPVILTLRSGTVSGLTVAAESCVSVKTLSATADRTTGIIKSPGVPITDGDYCFSTTEVSQCPGDTPRIARNIGFGEPVQQDITGNFICPPRNLRTTRVAILSSASATSLMG